MLLFGRLGCLGSLLASLALTALLYVLNRRVDRALIGRSADAHSR
jgi:hypothetical protein